MRRLFLIPLLFAALTASAGHRLTHHFQTSVPLRNIKRVVVAIPAGEIRVTNGSGNDIAVSGAVRRECDDDDDREDVQRSIDDIDIEALTASENLLALDQALGRGEAEGQRPIDDIDVEVYTNGSEAIVRRHYGTHGHGWRVTNMASVDLELTLPPGVDLDFETKAGEIWLEGTFGNVDTDLRAGEIHVRTPRANVKELNASTRIGEVHTSLGDRRIDREGVFPGTTHFLNPDGGRTTMNLHTTVGEVHVTLTK